MKLFPALLLLGLLPCCDRPEDRAATACRFEVSRHLVDPSSGTFDHVKVTRRITGRGPSGWNVSLVVKAKNGYGLAESSPVSCQLDEGFQVVELGE